MIQKISSLFLIPMMVISFFLPALGAEKEKGEIQKFTPFHFSVLGDNRPHGRPEKVIQPPMFKRAISEINLLGGDLTVIVGDLIRGYEKDFDLINREWDEFFRTCKAFEKPYYLTTGNHDIWNKKSEQVWKKRLGPLYYAFSYKGCRFICLNSEDSKKREFIWGSQLYWLKKELETHKNSKHIFRKSYPGGEEVSSWNQSERRLSDPARFGWGVFLGEGKN